MVPGVVPPLMDEIEARFARRRARLERAISREAPQLQAALDKLARPAVSLTAQQADEASIPLGGSKIGGLPDLPPGVTWPHREDKPLEFLAQINLGDAALFDREKLLPSTGLLSFFLDTRRFGANRATVLYFEGPDWQRLEKPDSLTARGLMNSIRQLWEGSRLKLPACSLSAGPAWTLPEWEASDWLTLGNLKPTAQEYPAYHRLQEQLENSLPKHQMLGHAHSLEGNVAHEAEQSTRQLDWAKDVQAIEQGALDWEVLLQLDHQDPELTLEGFDRMFFLIRREDLRMRRFDRVWYTDQIA